ncbi:hypothetical protein ANABIO4_38900 [Bacillus subtilis]|nr:hypothetical protein ANABIO4_38900 [Bacillus subtilis]
MFIFNSTILFLLACIIIWNGIKIEIGNVFTWKIYSVKRFFVKKKKTK